MAKIALNLFAVLLALVPYVHGQTIAPQWNWRVSSDFGPRSLPSWDFHEGVDFDSIGGPGTDPNADLGTPIPNLEGGPIFDIGRLGGFRSIEVQGRNTGHMWLYGHIFQRDVLDIPEFGSETMHWELRMNARLVLPNTTNEVSRNVIIRWDGDSAISAITTIGGDGRWVVDDEGYCVPDANQNCIEAKAIAEAGDLIAPMGDAAATNVHLHLGLNYPNDNPYADLQHPPDSLPVATVLRPENGHVMTAAELDDYGFKIEVNSLGGLDLDKVSFWIYQNKDPNQAIHLGTPGLPTFGYGGRVGESQNGISYSSDGEATGVQPFLINNDSLGHDKFIFRQNLTALNLPDGQHSFVAKIKDVNNNSVESSVVDFIPYSLAFLLGNHNFAFFQSLTAKPVKLTTAQITASQAQGEDSLLCGVRRASASRYGCAPRTARYTASYARGVALCPPLARLASAPLARSRAVEARPARGNGEKHLLCASRQSAGRSRSAIAPRTARSGEAYARRLALCPPLARLASARQARPDRTIAARAGIRLRRTPAPGLPQDGRRYTAPFARVAVGGRTSGGQLPRSPDADFFFFRPARKEFKIIAVLAANTANRIIHCDGETKNTGENYYG